MNTRWAIAVTLVIACGCGGDDGDGLTVTLDTGVVIGVQAGEARAWLGVPYAAPPTGANRFRPPQPSEPWSEPRDAAGVGSQCP